MGVWGIGKANSVEVAWRRVEGRVCGVDVESGAVDDESDN